MELIETPSTGGPPSSDRRQPLDTTSVTVRVAAPLTIASAKGGHADVTSVTVSVAGQDAQGNQRDPLATTKLKRSADGAWTGTLSGLTVGTPLTFTAKAVDSEDTVIFQGTHVSTLSSVGAQITIRLSAVDDGVANRLPKVAAISISNVSTGVPAALSITVKGSATERLDYQFVGSRFAPGNGNLTLASGTGTISSSYTPPSVPGWYTEQITVWNAQGNRVRTDFQVQVQTATLTTKLGPVVRGLTGQRTPAGVRWTANVSAAGDRAGLTYAWSFAEPGSSSGTFTDATTNPTVLTSYLATTTGTLTITVTDAAALTTTASLQVAAGLFPALPLMPKKATLLVNEIDYDQSGNSDPDEFIEILNPGSAAVDLTAYRFELVDGADNSAYRSLETTGSLAAGAFLVIGKQKVIGTLSSSTATLELTGSGSRIHNSRDGVRIVKKSDGRVVDAVHYEGVTAGFGEGSAAPEDPSAASSKSIGRCPNGFDSNDNGRDFRTMTATPGAANTCS